MKPISNMQNARQEAEIKLREGIVLFNLYQRHPVPQTRLTLFQEVKNLYEPAAKFYGQGSRQYNFWEDMVNKWIPELESQKCKADKKYLEGVLLHIETRSEYNNETEKFQALKELYEPAAEFYGQGSPQYKSLEEIVNILNPDKRKDSCTDSNE